MSKLLRQKPSDVPPKIRRVSSTPVNMAKDNTYDKDNEADATPVKNYNLIKNLNIISH